VTRILLIEDDVDLRCLLRTALQVAECEIVEAENGADGIQCYRKTPADLVITDMEMPIMGGLQVIQELRRACSTAKIIAMSGDHNSLDMAKALEVQYTLTKPFRLRELLTVVHQLSTAPAVASVLPHAAVSPQHLRVHA
jgi:CheY-like chemotaxis protein